MPSLLLSLHLEAIAHEKDQSPSPPLPPAEATTESIYRYPNYQETLSPEFLMKFYNLGLPWWRSG